MRVNKRKKIKIILSIVSIFLLLFILLNSYLIIKYNVLPLRYLIIYILVIILIPLVIIYLGLFKRGKYRIKIFFSIVEIIYIIVLLLIFIYLNNTLDIINNFTKNYKYETKNYYVVVLKESNYEELDDLTNKTIGYNSSLDTSAPMAFTKLENSLSMNAHEYDNFTLLFADLRTEDIDSVLIVDSFYEILTEADSELKDLIKVIYTFQIKEKISNLEKNVDVTSEVFNVYISGMDSYGNVTENSRSDVNIVMSVNPNTHEILLVNIPRDYYVKLYNIGKYDKLTHAGIYGIATSIGTIENLLDIEINYYIKVNYNAMIKLVDALGGVDVYSEYSFTSYSGYHFTEGYNYVNGVKALDFVRTRKAFENGDRVRGQNQQAMIEAIFAKVNSSTTLLKYNELLMSLEDTFSTNLSTNQIVSLVNKQLDEMASWNITSISVNGTDGSEYTYSYPSQKLYVMIQDEDSLKEVKEALVEFTSK